MNSLHYLENSFGLVFVLLSVVIAIFSSIIALMSAQVASKAERSLRRHTIIGIGAIAFTVVIWLMHFVNILAAEQFTPESLLTAQHLLSALPNLCATWIALHALSSHNLSGYQLLVSGLAVGLCVAVMHCIDVMAAHTPAFMRHDPVKLVFKMVFDIIVGAVSLWVPYALRKTSMTTTQWLLASGLILGVMLIGMHSLNMESAAFMVVKQGPTEAVGKDATIASIVLGVFTVMAAIVITVMNVLIRMRELYKKMEGSKLRLRSIMETAVDGIITIDRQGLIQDFNKSAERIFGWQANEVIGHNIKMLMPEPDRASHERYIHNYENTGVAKIIGSGREVMGQRKDGSELPLRLAVGRVDLPDELLYVGFVTDISERHALESSLRATAERAERAAAAKSIFLANMSHEIRTPMNAIIGFTEQLLQSPLTSAQRSHLDIVWHSSRSLLGLLNDILDTTKIDVGGVELESIDFSLKEVARQVESTLRLSAQARQLNFVMAYPRQVPEHFKGDPLRVQQLLTNLVGNAIKFTEHGSVMLAFSYVDGMVNVRVRDTGIGMTPQQIESIFTAFSQADASISRRFGGTGLGTTIARQLVELMDGSIEVHSKPGAGSTFLVRLPLQLGSAPDIDNTGDALQCLTPQRVLVADDVPQNLELVQLMLEKEGHQVVTVHSGEQAVCEFIAARFDLVLMDVHMPGIDGLEATRRIREHEKHSARARVPIIALTASVMGDDRLAAQKAGMNGFAIKPLDAANLMTEIARVLFEQADDYVRIAAEAGESAAIDWVSGISLWGSRSRLTQALESFLKEAEQRYPLPEPGQQAIDWKVVQASLHSIRGVAGNLALTQVAMLAGELEQGIKQGMHAAVLPQIADLRDRLDEVATALRASVAERTNEPRRQAED